MSARGRRPKLDSATRIEDDASIAAAVEVTRRRYRFKPLRDKGGRTRPGDWGGREGVYRLVSRVYLGDRLGPDAVEQAYRRWKKGARVFDFDKLQALAVQLKDRYNPGPDTAHPTDDPPLENPRHVRWSAKHRLRGPTQRGN